MKLTDIDAANQAYTNLPFKGDAIFNVSDNIVKLKPHLDVVLTAKNKIIRKLTGGEQISNTHPKWSEFIEEYNKLIDKDVEVGDLFKVKKSDFDLPKDSAIPGAASMVASLKRLNLFENV